METTLQYVKNKVIAQIQNWFREEYENILGDIIWRNNFCNYNFFIVIYFLNKYALEGQKCMNQLCLRILD